MKCMPITCDGRVVAAAIFVMLMEDVLLARMQLFGGGFDDEPGFFRGVGDAGEGFDVRQRIVLVACGRGAFGYLPVEIFRDGLEGFFQLRCIDVGEVNTKTGLCEYVCDTVSHCAGTYDCDFFQRHLES